MNELPSVMKWIHSTVEAALAADYPEVTVWSELVPKEAAFPAVRYTFLGGHDVKEIATHRILTHHVFIVEAIDENLSIADIIPVSTLFDDALQANAGELVDGVWILSCERMMPWARHESQLNRQFKHLGGNYRILAHRAN